MAAELVGSLHGWTSAVRESSLLADHLTDERLCTLRFLVRATDRLACALKVVTPQVAVEENAAVNATLVTLTSGRAILVLSTGLLDRLRIDEACAVIAHELAHLAHADPGCPASPLNRGSLMGRLLGRWHMAIWAVRNRRRELAADLLAARLVGIDALIGALKKSERIGRSAWIGTHPAPRARIRNLRRHGTLMVRRPWNPTGRTAFPA
jgi:Zn-dependent protease with chaperone function